MKQKMSQIFGSEGLRQSAFVAVGNVGATGFSAISLIILSRFLGPNDFGGFSVAFSLTQLVGSITDFGFNLSLQRFVAAHAHLDEAKTAAAIQIVGKVKLFAMVLTIIAGLLLGPTLAATIFHVNNPALIILGIALSSVVLLYGYVITIIQAISKFTQAVVLNAVQALLKCSLAIISFLILAPDPTFAYLWYGLAPLLASVIGLTSITKYFVHLSHPEKIWSEIVRVARFGAIAVLAIAVSDNIDVLMVNASLTEYQTGLYAAASRVALMLAVFGSSFGIVFNTRVAKYKNKIDLNKYLSKALSFSLISLLLIPFGLLLSRPLLLLTAGTSFMAALPTLNYLIISAFVMMAAVPFIAVFYAVDFPAYFAISGIVQAAILIVGNIILIPMFGISGAGIAKLITRVTITLYTIAAAYYYSKRQFDQKSCS